MGDLEQSRTVVVYCAHGQERSQMCAATLAQLGFAASYLEGGFAQWLADGLPVTSHPRQSIMRRTASPTHRQ
ncbi:hypothetical protein LA345_39610 (plasmid) [Burkholderia vietnamiensis]|nr:hypothetical protein [Burkholderia vietnamiensis]MCB4349901.1 hypothetical protein [Burkholderia vietnamiensis]MCB4349902.1 hypothetical protein [Burkholderia vietnamiensis]